MLSLSDSRASEYRHSCAAGMSMIKDVLPEERKLVKDSEEVAKRLVKEFGQQYASTGILDGTGYYNYQFKAAAFETERLFTFMQKTFPKASTSSQSPAKSAMAAAVTNTMAAAATGRPERLAKRPENTIEAKVSGALRFTSSPLPLEP